MQEKDEHDQMIQCVTDFLSHSWLYEPVKNINFLVNQFVSSNEFEEFDVEKQKQVIMESNRVKEFLVELFEIRVRVKKNEANATIKELEAQVN